MSRTSRCFRYLALGLAFAQYALPGVFAVADGRLAEASLNVPAVHVESPDHHCPGLHHPDNCAICQLLAHGTGPLPELCSIPLFHTAAASTRVNAEPEALPAPTLDYTLLPRAPPIA
jgi:hypothetical protein